MQRLSEDHGDKQRTYTPDTHRACLLLTCKNTDSQGCVSIDFTLYYQTLRRLGVNDKSLFKTIKKQLLILFGIPVVYSVIASFCMLASLNNVYNVLLANEFIYLFYFAGGLAIFFFIYGIYWIATYIGFKRNINEES